MLSIAYTISPPNIARSSIKSTLAPRRDAASAAAIPAGVPPTTKTSQSEIEPSKGFSVAPLGATLCTKVLWDARSDGGIIPAERNDRFPHSNALATPIIENDRPIRQTRRALEAL